MDKAVLMSIKPKYCELIASGKKTIEVRKTKPKIEAPFKVYIYCTKPRHYYKISRHLLTSDESLFLVNGKVKKCDGFGVEYEDREYKHLNCKVIGEFVCDDVAKILNHGSSFSIEGIDECKVNRIARASCLDFADMKKYFGEKDGYAWHISDLVIYNKPKELSEFMLCKKTNCPAYLNGICLSRENNDVILCENLDCQYKKITRPPQSWCYVENHSSSF